MNKSKLNRRNRGFALVVTLSLMILLTIVAVGMLTLATISLRRSSNGDIAAQAEANARMAMMLAIGQLQREMGPDSRISAPADAGTPVGGQPHWTATYDAWQDAENAPETPGSRSPVFREWLASGANAATGGPAGTPDLVQLIGPGSTGNAADQVSVPMHQVSVGSRRGRVAWWVADEGVKAKVNAGPDAITTASFGTSDPLFNAQSPPNINQKAIPALATMDWKDGHRAKTITAAAVNLAAGLGVGALADSIHDITVHSAGVLADVRTGRLKRDLGNLLARPVSQVTNMPLYLADGRMNRFNIAADGTVSNNPIVRAWNQAYNSADQWGINLEELHLFHNLHRELNWSGNKPSLVAKSSREAVVRDRFYMYRRPTVQGLQFIFSLKAIPDPKFKGKYKMQMNLDGMVILSNPNDVPMQYPPGLLLPFQLLNVPYDVNWKIRRSNGTMLEAKSGSSNFNLFKGHIEGGTNGIPATGFTLQPGEAAVFGTSTASGSNLNLSRGFAPSGGVALTEWELNAGNLDQADTVDFEITRLAKTTSGNAWTYYNAWIGPRASGGWQMDSAALFGGSLEGSMDDYLPPAISPPQARPVSDFVNKPQPVLMLSFLQNVEQASGSSPPDAFASRPFLLNEPALTERSMNPDRFKTDRHATQMLITAEEMNYEFGNTAAAGDGGRNSYIGGGRQFNLGGSFSVVSRRVPIAPPLSLGSFQNAIASGFSDHFSEGSLRTSGQVGGNSLAVGNDPFPANAEALTGHIHALPLVSRAIGNSHQVPHLEADEVFSQSNNTTAARGSVGRVATDHSWMANTALWDSWFLSSIVDGTGAANTPLMKDPRTPRAQFSEFAEGKKTLRNKRFIFHPSKPMDQAITELFTGQNFKNSAINDLSKYLLVDGAFNVNSTSPDAWAALLSSVRDQEILTASGSTQPFNHPFGTIGYATSTATSGTEGDWSGLRDLDDADIEDLAEAIVEQVKARGPFLSLADFINRRPDSNDSVHQSLGALQAAIDTCGLNSRYGSGGRRSAPSDFAPIAGSDSIGKEPEPARAIGSRGHLSQGDLLTAIGSQITVRSDTFKIRSYGDARDASGKIIATAWCEAIVQRVPEYVDPTNPPEAQAGWPAASTELAPANSRFGRRMVVRSFRWLTRGEI